MMSSDLAVRMGFEIGQESRDEIANILERKNEYVPQVLHGMLWEQKASAEPFDIIPVMTHQEFISFLRQLSKREIHSKHKNALISPAIFVPLNRTESSRAERDILYLNGLWLDFEDGHLTHRQFADMFPHTRIVTFNSYGNSKAKPRFRAYVPTDEIMHADSYRTVMSEIMRVVSGNGYVLPKRDESSPDRKAHGIDRSALAPTSLFYLPCRAADPEGSFFKDYTRKGREPLCPSDWVRHAIFRDDEPSASFSNQAAEGSVDQARVDRALAQWRREGVQPKCGNDGFFRLGVELNASKVPHDRIESILKEEALAANTPSERLRAVPRIMKRLRR